MKHTFTTEQGYLKANVAFDKEEIDKAQNKAIRKLVQNVTVPGFRKGKAPEDMTTRYLKANDIANETINGLLRVLDSNFEKDEEFSSYVKDNKFANGLRPNVNLTKFSNDEAEFIITYYLKPVVDKLGSYTDLKTTVEEKTITDEDVQAEIAKLAADNAELIPSEKAAEMGDTVNIDFVGLLDGQPFDGGTSNSFDLELGSKRFVPGFEEQCVSHKAGEKFDVHITMPENYPAPLTGKNVIFKVTLNEVKTKEVPEINDEFATTLSGQYVAKDLAELQEKVKNVLTKKAFDDYKRAVVNDLLLQVRNNTTFIISSEYINQLVEDRVKQQTSAIENQGLSLKEYLKLINQSEEEFTNVIKAGLENEIKTSLVYDAIMKATEVPAPTASDIEKQIGTPINKFATDFTSYLKKQNVPQSQIDNQINSYLNQVYSSLVTANVQAKLLELNLPELAARTLKVEEPKVEEAPAEEAKENVEAPAAEEVKEETSEAEEVKPEESAAE